MDINNKEIISRLKFIGKIQSGEKINTRYMYVQPSGLLTKLSRTFYNQDNRSNALSFLQDTITKSFDILTNLEKSNKESDKLLCLNIARDLRNAKFGIIKLKDTYLNDIKFICDSETFLEDIDTKLKELNEKYPNEVYNEVQNEFSNEAPNTLITLSNTLIKHNNKFNQVE